MDSGRGFDGGDTEPSYGEYRMFSTLCDRTWPCVGLSVAGREGFSGIGVLCGTCCSGRNALRMLEYALPEFVSSDPK